MLSIRNLDVYYGDAQALTAVSLDVPAGELVALVGANGAGKSSLIRSIAGMETPRSGTITFRDTEITGRDTHFTANLGIGQVAEGRQIFPSLTVEENLLVGAYRSRPGAWTVSKVVELFPLLGRLLRRSAAKLSGGEQQALAIGRALMANPRLLLLDEVSLGLAPVIVNQLYDALPGILANGITLLLVEQDISKALSVADRVTCLLEGRVSLTGRPDDLNQDDITVAYFGLPVSE